MSPPKGHPVALQAMHEQYARLLHQRRLEQESAAAAAAAATRNPVTSCSRAAAAAVLAAAGQGAGRRRAKPAWRCDTSTSLQEATLEATLRSHAAATDGRVARKVSPQGADLFTGVCVAACVQMSRKLHRQRAAGFIRDAGAP